MVCRKGKCFAVRRHPAARKSSPVPLTLSLILRATQLSPGLTHRIPMRPSEVLIPFAHPPRTPPSYPYDPPFIFMIWTLNIHLLESPIPQRRRWRPSGKLREPVCRPPPRAPAPTPPRGSWILRVPHGTQAKHAALASVFPGKFSSHRTSMFCTEQMCNQRVSEGYPDRFLVPLPLPPHTSGI